MINSLGGISTAAHTVANTVESLFYIPGWGMQTSAATLSGNAWGAKDHERLKRLGSVIRLGTTVLRMVAVSEPFYGVPIVVEGLMQGVGKTIAPFVYNAVGMWGIRIAGTFLCTQALGMGLIAAWGVSVKPETYWIS